MYRNRGRERGCGKVPVESARRVGIDLDELPAHMVEWVLIVGGVCSRVTASIGHLRKTPTPCIAFIEDLLIPGPKRPKVTEFENCRRARLQTQAGLATRCSSTLSPKLKLPHTVAFRARITPSKALACRGRARREHLEQLYLTVQAGIWP